jgi:hypothetical protein
VEGATDHPSFQLLELLERSVLPQIFAEEVARVMTQQPWASLYTNRLMSQELRLPGVDLFVPNIWTISDANALLVE